jgi:phosphate transport system protein
VSATVARQHSDHIYAAQLHALRETLLLMGARVEALVADSIRALVARDSSLARRTMEADGAVNALERDIDDQCVSILARRQPFASDLRFITTALKLVTDLERIGDEGVNVCERVLELNQEPPFRPHTDLVTMADIALSMVRQALDAFVAHDADRAEAVLARDDTLDAHCARVFRELLACMMADPSCIPRARSTQSIAKYLERIGDHATNLAEMVVFMVKGNDIRHVRRSGAPPA